MRHNSGGPLNQAVTTTVTSKFEMSFVPSVFTTADAASDSLLRLGSFFGSLWEVGGRRPGLSELDAKEEAAQVGL
jgi:hypothetical protein